MTRQEAKEILERMPTPFSYGHTTAEAIEAIDMAIKALDIVECQECRYWTSDGGALMGCDLTGSPCGYDDYCSYGERESE